MWYEVCRFLVRLYPPGFLVRQMRLRAAIAGEVDGPGFLRLFMANTGFDRAEPRDRAAVGARLRRRLRRSTPGFAAGYVGQFARLAHLHASPRTGLVLLESYLRIEPSDYPAEGEPGVGRLAARLDRARAESGPAAVADLALVLVGSCTHVEGRGGYAANAVIRAFFGLRDGGLGAAEFERRLAPAFRRLDDMRAVMALQALAVTWIGTGRKAEARALCLWFFGIDDPALADHRRLSALVEARLEGFDPAPAMIAKALVPIVLHPILGPETVIGTVEDFLGITPDAYDDPAALAARIAPIPDPEIRLSVAQMLIEALRFSGQHDRAEAALRAFLADDSGPPGDAEGLARRHAALAGRLHPHQRPVFQMMIMDALFRSGDLAAAAHRGEEILGIGPGDYALGPGAVAAQIRRSRAGFAPDELPGLMLRLAGSLLDSDGRRGDLATLLDAYLWGVLDLGRLGRDWPSASELVCHLVGIWLDLAEADRAFPRCRPIVEFLRACLRLRGVRFEDRARFVRDIGSIRRALSRIGRAGAAGDRLAWADAVCWDVELGQRLLFERYRFLDGDGASLAEVADPSGSRGLKLGWSLHREPPDGDGDDAGGADLAVCFGYDSGEDAEAPATPDEAVEGAPSGLDEAARLLESGVGADQVAAAIGAGGILLRIGFLPDGRVAWDASRSDGLGIDRVAGREGGDESARSSLDRAVAWHDRVIAALWAEQGRDDRPLRDLARDVRGPIRQVVARLAGGRGAPPAEPDALGGLAARVLDDARRHGADPWLADWLGSAVPADWAASLADRRPALAGAWRRVGAVVEAIADGPIEQALDRATGEFLAGVGDLLDLADLGPHLDPGADVVVEVEGPLHAIPIALVRVGEGGRLGDLARSVRVGISLLIDLLRPPDDASPAGPEGPGRLLTVSWFEPGDPAASGAYRLHRDQGRLALAHSLAWESAGDDPPGDEAAIRLALAGPGPVRLLTVCGHGRLHGPGVRLRGDAPWTGRGCDFSKVDWLFLVSCSLGRVRHDAAASDDEAEPPDVDGFVAHLVARRVRSVLACRWPVHGPQASRFANLVAEEFLRAGPGGRGRRSPALNRARSLALATPGTVGLNTVAAFELYGQG